MSRCAECKLRMCTAAGCWKTAEICRHLVTVPRVVSNSAPLTPIKQKESKRCFLHLEDSSESHGVRSLQSLNLLNTGMPSTSILCQGEAECLAADWKIAIVSSDLNANEQRLCASFRTEGGGERCERPYTETYRLILHAP